MTCMPTRLNDLCTSTSLQVHYLEAPASDYVTCAVQAVVDLHTENLPGDVLVFMTGAGDASNEYPLLVAIRIQVVLLLAARVGT